MASIGEQFSCGDQSKDSRYRFWNEGFQICPVCKSKNIRKTSEVAGVRHNGDAYGTDVFVCSDCKWMTSFQYDDASETYYYETVEFRRRWEEERHPKVYRDLTNEDKTKYLKLYQQNRITHDMIRACLTDELVKKEQIEVFLKEF